uniref:RAP domain-containing protein n=1 Tax=Oreochromis aureus TaxID=47969 RepID=A0A668UZP6_OREAU
MKSLVCLLASARAASPFPLNCGSVRKRTSVEFSSNTVRCLQITRGTEVKLMSEAAVPLLRKRDTGPSWERTGRRTAPQKAPGAAPRLSPYITYAKPQSKAAALLDIQSLFEEDVIAELCSRLEAFPRSDRAEGLASLLGACVEFGLEAHSPPVLTLMNECLELLPNRDIGVAQLCRLGEVVCALEGRRSRVLTEVLDCVCAAVEEDVVSPSEAVMVYSLLTRFCEPASQQQTRILSALHTDTRRLVHRLKAGQVSDILQSLLKLQQRQAVSLVLRLSHRASRVFKAFRDDEIMKVLSALMTLGQHDGELVAAMEKHLTGVFFICDPELIGAIMEYCLQMRCRSEPLFEAVAENFVRHAEKHTTLQIAKQIVAMGRLNYLPQCSSQMFKKLDSILSERFSQFQPRSLVDVMHACIHLERFPLNYMTKVFSPHFLQRLQERVGSSITGVIRLYCSPRQGPRLPFFLHVKRFSSAGQAFETPMESLLYKQVKGPLAQLLGGTLYSTRMIHGGYTIGKLQHVTQHHSTWIVLCLDGPNRFCTNTRHLLGKEVTKRRHLQRMGMELVEIPYFEFEKLQTEEEQIQEIFNVNIKWHSVRL